MFNKKLKEEITTLREKLNESYDKYIKQCGEVLRLQTIIDAEKHRPDLPWANHDMEPAERASRAKEIISNPLMQEIFSGIETGLIERLKSADLSNHVELIAYTQGLQILEQMVKYIEDRVYDQKVVEFNLKQANKARH